MIMTPPAMACPRVRPRSYMMVVALAAVLLRAHATAPPPGGSCGYDNVTQLPGMNLGMTDYRHMPSPSAQDCQQRCCGDLVCRGFTFTSYQPLTAAMHAETVRRQWSH